MRTVFKYMNTFWDKYYKKPLNEIPWQNTQADWFKELVDLGEITGDSALDLGCGTGKKSIYLAQKGKFKKVLGIDISKQAIEYANKNAQDNNVEKICSFQNYNLQNKDWLCIPSQETFDFILDWAAIHCFTRNEVINYADNITRHCKTGGKLLVRSFASYNKEQKEFSDEIDGIKSQVSLYNEKELCDFFNQFRILMKNTSQPSKTKTDVGYFFIELLMQKV